MVVHFQPVLCEISHAGVGMIAPDAIDTGRIFGSTERPQQGDRAHLFGLFGCEGNPLEGLRGKVVATFEEGPTGSFAYGRLGVLEKSIFDDFKPGRVVAAGEEGDDCAANLWRGIVACRPGHRAPTGLGAACEQSAGRRLPKLGLAGTQRPAQGPVAGCCPIRGERIPDFCGEAWSAGRQGLERTEQFRAL